MKRLNLTEANNKDDRTLYSTIFIVDVKYLESCESSHHTFDW